MSREEAAARAEHERGDEAEDEDIPWFLRGGGVSGSTARAVDWAQTPLGPPERWPTTLKATLGTMFRSRQPMFLWWGEELVQFYNDAYLPSFGEGKHPRAMGQRGRECWGEIWPIIGPQIDDVMQRAIGSWHEDSLVPIHRNGRIEDVYWTYAYSPVFDERGAVAGTLVICTETTNRVLNARRMQTLQALVSAISSARDVTELFRAAMSVLRQSSDDIPLAAICERGERSSAWRCREAIGLGPADAVTLCERATRERDSARLLSGIVEIAPAITLHRDSAPAIETCEAYVEPLSHNDPEDSPSIVFGLSPRLPFDAGYRQFLVQIATQLRAAKARLQDSTRRATIETERLRLLEDAARAKDQFLAMLGHELRNPLSPMLTALHLMQSRGEDSPEQQVIARQVHHLIRLVDDLLDVSKIARGKIELRRERVDLAEVIVEAVEMVSDLLEHRHHHLEIDCDPDHYHCVADRFRLAQVFANLIANSAKYTEPHGRIAVRASEQDGELVVCIEDNGQGISRELLPRVFTLFEQGRRSADRAQGGLGIGLALVKNFVELHGGRVSASSQGEGHGSVFTVHLPRATPSTQTMTAVKPEEPRAPVSGRRVLVVDDNLDAARLLELTLKRAGHEAAIATDALKALETAASFVPDVAVLDIGLPVVDGYELARRLREVSGCEACRLIALTGYGQRRDRERSREAGFEEHLVKPVPIDSLLRLIDRSEA